MYTTVLGRSVWTILMLVSQLSGVRFDFGTFFLQQKTKNLFALVLKGTFYSLKSESRSRHCSLEHCSLAFYSFVVRCIATSSRYSKSILRITRVYPIAKYRYPAATNCADYRQYSIVETTAQMIPTMATVSLTLFFKYGFTVSMKVIRATSSPTPVPILTLMVASAYSWLPSKTSKLDAATESANKVVTQRNVTKERMFLAPTQLFSAAQ